MNIYEIRKRGRELCQTDGSEHYKRRTQEPIEKTIEEGNGKGFCIGSIRKYLDRYNQTDNLKDIIKLADYAIILAAVHEIEEGERATDWLERKIKGAGDREG